MSEWRDVLVHGESRVSRVHATCASKVAQCANQWTKVSGFAENSGGNSETTDVFETLTVHTAIAIVCVSCFGQSRPEFQDSLCDVTVVCPSAQIQYFREQTLVRIYNEINQGILLRWRQLHTD